MSQSFQKVAVLWKKDKRQWVKPSSYATYVSLLNTHLLPFFGDRRSISEAQVQEYASRKYAAGLSVKTVRDTLVVLGMILRHGEKCGAWRHVSFDVHFPPEAGLRRPVQVLSKQQQLRLQGYLLDNLTCRNLGILICLHTGLRIGEVCGLQWKDVDMAAGVLCVRRTVQRVWLSDGTQRANPLLIGPPKTVSSMREIPLSRELKRVLRPFWKSALPENYLVSDAAGPLEPRYFRDYFRRVLARLGIPPLRFHALRHSFATRCIESRCDYKSVSAILGHASISTTLDLYVHPDYATKRRVIDQMTRSLEKG